MMIDNFFLQVLGTISSSDGTSLEVLTAEAMTEKLRLDAAQSESRMDAERSYTVWSV